MGFKPHLATLIIITFIMCIIHFIEYLDHYNSAPFRFFYLLRNIITIFIVVEAFFWIVNWGFIMPLIKTQ